MISVKIRIAVLMIIGTMLIITSIVTFISAEFKDGIKSLIFGLICISGGLYLKKIYRL